MNSGFRPLTGLQKNPHPVFVASAFTGHRHDESHPGLIAAILLALGAAISGSRAGPGW